MTHSEFNHLLSGLDALSPDQLRQLIRKLQSKLAVSGKPAPAQSAAGPVVPKAKPATRAKPAGQPAEKPITIEELHRQMMARGLITQLPNPDEDIDDDDVPVVIEGEPLSETIIRERR
jgi:hypothetical protein